MNYTDILERAEELRRRFRAFQDGEDQDEAAAVERACSCARYALHAFLDFSNKPGDAPDLEYLLDLCGDIDESFYEFFNDIATLEYYRTAFSGGSEAEGLSVTDVLEAIRLAEKLLDFVTEKTATTH
jgi:hypothetical protein